MIYLERHAVFTVRIDQLETKLIIEWEEREEPVSEAAEQKVEVSVPPGR